MLPRPGWATYSGTSKTSIFMKQKALQNSAKGNVKITGFFAKSTRAAHHPHEWPGSLHSSLTMHPHPNSNVSVPTMLHEDSIWSVHSAWEEWATGLPDACPPLGRCEPLPGSMDGRLGGEAYDDVPQTVAVSMGSPGHVRVVHSHKVRKCSPLAHPWC